MSAEVAMTDRQLRAELSRQCEVAGGQSAWARQWGVAPSQVCEAISGRRDIPLGILNAMGLMRVVRYVPLRRAGYEVVEQSP